MDGFGGGFIILVIIGIVLNMIIKAMRAQPPVQQRPPQRPGQPAHGQDVHRPYADRPLPRPVHPPRPPRAVPRREPVHPSKGVSLEGFSAETPAMESMKSMDSQGEPTVLEDTPVRAPSTTHPFREWFQGDGVVRGIVMSEVLGPPVSRRR